MFLAYWFLVLCLEQTLTSASTDETPCRKDEMPCDSDGCVARNSWCDSHEDCDDGSDEKYCYTYGNSIPTCKLHHFKCADLTCIPLGARCDGFDNCKDGSDERNCENVTWVKHNYPQPKVPVHKQSISTELTLNNFQELLESYKMESLEKCERWILNHQKTEGWGKESSRVRVALYFSNFYHNLPMRTLKKQLEIQIMTDILRNSSKNIDPSKLAMNINALLASCQNPRNFQRLNLVQKLRFEVDSMSNGSVPPIIFLTLCLVNETRYEDLYSLYSSLTTQGQNTKLDYEALAVMAMYCIATNNEYENKYLKPVLDIANQLKRKVALYQMDLDVYTAALIIQGLKSVSSHIEWDESSTVKKLLSFQHADGSFGDLLGTYYAMPVLAGKTYLSLRDVNCSRKILKTDNPMELPISEESKITIRYSLWVGSPVQQTHSISLKISSDWNLFEVMKFAAEQNKKFSVKYEEAFDGPQVFSVAEIPNDGVKELYWTFYKHDANSALKKAIGLGLMDKLSNGDNIVLWFKRKDE